MNALMEDQERTVTLVDHAKAGDREAFDRLLARFQGRLRSAVESWSRYQLGAQIEMDDVLQETFVRAFRSLERFEWQGDDSFFRWLCGIAKRALAQAIQDQRTSHGTGSPSNATGSGPTQTNISRRVERFERLEDALRSLSPEYREVLLLSRVEGLGESLPAAGAAVGLMVRGGLESGASSATAILEPRRSPLGQSGRFRFRYRSSPGAMSRTDTGESTDAAAGWVRLERSGGTVTAWNSTDGVEWTQIGDPQPLPGLPETVLAGLVAVGRDLELETNAFEPLQALVSELQLGGSRFLRGDCNDDGAVDISDAVFTLGSLFLGQGDPSCDDACDSNDDGKVDISDAINTLGVLFLGDGVIPVPGITGCGVDPTGDEIGCKNFGRCP